MATCPRCSKTLDRATDGADGGLCRGCMLEQILSPPQPILDGETFGPFEILCRLGEGGLGIVYLAEQSQPVHREVALKVIKPGMASPETAARSRTERQALALMDHPHIARMIDAGTSSAGRPFFAMEYVDGVPITEYCDRHSLGIPQRLALFAEVCQAVDYAHRKGILHRDLKPSNVLVTEDQALPVPKIIDFGVAKALGTRLTGQTLQTEAGQLLGTPEYMSPEQADLSNRGLDATADVYSLGVMLYELLCGALPFDAERLRNAGLAEILRIVREEEPPAPRVRLRQLGPAAETRAQERGASVTALSRQLSGDLAAVVRTAMAKDRRLRYASAAALAADLARYSRNQPVQAHAPSLLYRARKLAGRHRATLAAVSAMLAVVCAAAWFVSRSRLEADLKLTQLTDYNGYEFDPALSPDGKRLAFVWNNDSTNYDIYIKPVDGAGDPFRLTTNPAHDLHPSWSPDGRSIAFLRTSPSTKEIWIAAASGGPERKVMDTSASAGPWEQDASIMDRTAGPAWSPDGKNLAVADRAASQGPDCIYLVSLLTGQTAARRKLTSPGPASPGDALPAFSPSGRQIAFVRAASQRGITDIYITAVSGGEARQVTFDRKTITGLAWISEKRLVFTSNRAGGNMLWSISASGGAPELIAIAGRNVSRVSAANRLGRLVFDETFRNTNIWRVDLSRPGAPAERLISTTRRNDSPKYSPDGKSIVFGSDRSGTYELWVADADGLHTRKITSFSGAPIGTPRWSPDGRQIVFDAGKDGHSVIYTIGAAGGQPHLFASGRFDDMMPSWSRDGRSIYFAAPTEGGALRVWKKPVDGAPAVQLTHRAGGEAVESLDGKTVYFSNGRDGIWRVSPEGSGEYPVPGLETVRHSRYFTLGPGGAYFLRADTPPWVIDFYDFATHKTVPAATVEKGILYGSPNLTVSPDGHWLLYTQMDDSGSDVMMLDRVK